MQPVGPLAGGQRLACVGKWRMTDVMEKTRKFKHFQKRAHSVFVSCRQAFILNNLCHKMPEPIYPQRMNETVVHSRREERGITSLRTVPKALERRRIDNPPNMVIFDPYVPVDGIFNDVRHAVGKSFNLLF